MQTAQMRSAKVTIFPGAMAPLEGVNSDGNLGGFWLTITGTPTPVFL